MDSRSVHSLHLIRVVQHRELLVVSSFVVLLTDELTSEHDKIALNSECMGTKWSCYH